MGTHRPLGGKSPPSRSRRQPPGLSKNHQIINNFRPHRPHAWLLRGPPSGPLHGACGVEPVVYVKFCILVVAQAALPSQTGLGTGIDSAGNPIAGPNLRSPILKKVSRPLVFSQEMFICMLARTLSLSIGKVKGRLPARRARTRAGSPSGLDLTATCSGPGQSRP